MTDQIVNSNLSNFVCINLKMVSGEEILAHVDPDMLLDEGSPSLVLHDPFLVTIDRGLVIMSLWLICNKNNEQVISKDDIMVSNRADEKFESTYLNLLEKKLSFEQELDDRDDFLDVVISDGSESVH